MQVGSRNKAKMAIANKLAKLIYKMMKDSECKYRDPGPMMAKTPGKQIKNLLNRLKKLGVDIEYHTEEKIVAKSKQEINV